MRTDYALYAVAIICFIITGAVAAYQVEQSLWIVTTAVLGLVFIGLGYTQRPREAITTATSISPPPPPMTPPTVSEVIEEKKDKPEPATEPIVELQTQTTGLLEVKGIGQKRLEQLNALGIRTIQDLAKTSPKELAAKLKISPKITGRWIENAKGIVEKS